MLLKLERTRTRMYARERERWREMQHPGCFHHHLPSPHPRVDFAHTRRPKILQKICKTFQGYNSTVVPKKCHRTKVYFTNLLARYLLSEFCVTFHAIRYSIIGFFPHPNEAKLPFLVFSHVHLVSKSHTSSSFRTLFLDSTQFP